MPIFPRIDARNSGKLSKPSTGMPSRRSAVHALDASEQLDEPGASPGFRGATEKPQLPATTVVTPWKQLEVP